VNWIREHFWILAILILSVALRISLGQDRDRWPLTTAEADWERRGLIYATHGLGVEDLTTYRSPLYPLSVAAIYAGLGTKTVFVRAYQTILSVLTLLVIYRLAHRLTDPRSPLVAAVIAGFYPLWTLIGASILPNTLTTFVAALTCLVAVRTIENPSVGRALLFGGVCGLCSLASLVEIIWVPVIVGVVLWFSSEGPFGDQFNRFGAVACGVLVVLVPWMIRNEVVTGHRLFPPNNTGMELLIGQEPGARGILDVLRDYVSIYERAGIDALDPVDKDDRVFAGMVRIMRESPGRTARLAGRKVWLLWNSVMLNAPSTTRNAHFVSGVLLSVLGVLGLYVNRRSAMAVVVASMVLVWTLYGAIFYVTPELRLPVDVCLVPFAASTGLLCLNRVRSVIASRFRELGSE
jgi:hypothetical protein